MRGVDYRKKPTLIGTDWLFQNVLHVQKVSNKRNISELTTRYEYSEYQSNYTSSTTTTS